MSIWFEAYLLPVLVTVTCGSTTATAAIAWSLYRTVNEHDRALFGSPEIDHHEGLISYSAVTRETVSELGERVESLETTAAATKRNGR